MNLGLSWIGSFQDPRLRFSTENPLEEVWAQLGRYGTDEHLKRHSPDDKSIPWDEYLKYVQVRVRQALEFRAAARASTLLTAPLPMYYSFLNMTRAFLALVPEKMPRAGHGLRFCKGDDLLRSSARLAAGTFADYLKYASVPWKEGDEIKLADALGFIVELAGDYRTLDPARSYVQTIGVDAKRGGSVSLRFFGYDGDFAQNWQADFPELVPVCKHGDGSTLIVADEQVGKTYEGIGEFYVAMFILGSAVRYEPELMLSVSGSDSEAGWLLRRFMAQAERFGPHLKLSEIFRRQTYFSGAL